MISSVLMPAPAMPRREDANVLTAFGQLLADFLADVRQLRGGKL